MPSLVRDTSSVKQRSFAPYEGPEPTRGFYRSKITKVEVRKAKNTDSLMFFIVTSFEASPTRPENSRYNGYPGFVYLTLGDKEPLLEREQAFYLAVSGKEKVKVETAGDPNKLKRGEGTAVTKIDGKNPVGMYVLTELRVETDERDGHEGESRLRADGVYPTRDQNAYAGEQVAGQTSAVDDEEDGDDTDEEALYEEADLKGLSLAELRRILSEEFDIDPAGIKGKANLVEAILEAQADADDGDVDDEEADEEEDDLDEDEEADEEDEEDDLEARIDEEIAPLDRNGLKAALKKRQPDRKFKTSETDEMLRGELRELMLQDPPF